MDNDMGNNNDDDMTTAVKSFVSEMMEAIQKQDTNALKVSLQKVKEDSSSASSSSVVTTTSPQEIVDYLVPYLFENTPQEDDVSSSTTTTTTSTTVTAEDALTLVGCLVGMDSTTYLKRISRAVKRQAKLLRSSSSSMSSSSMSVSTSFLSVIVTQLSTSDDIEVSSNATETLVDCCRSNQSSLTKEALALITTKWKEAWNNLKTTGNKKKIDRNTSSTICVRCASAVVDLVLLTDNVMELALLSSGSNNNDGTTSPISLLLEMVQYDNDPLLQMSVLDLVEKMATQQPIYLQRVSNWLCTDPTLLRSLLQMAGGGSDDEEPFPDPINGGSALRVLSAICRLNHQQTTIASSSTSSSLLLLGFHKALHNFIEQGSGGGGELDRLALIDAISSFASASSEALELVLQDPVIRDTWLSLQSVAQPKIKAVILNSVAMVIDPPPKTQTSIDGGEDNNNNNSNNTLSTALALKLFAQLGGTPTKDSTELVLGLAKSSPLVETRLGAYNLLRAVASQTQTGSQMLLSHTGFYDWLVSSSSSEGAQSQSGQQEQGGFAREPTKEGREGKFAVVQAVYDSPVRGLLAEDIVKKLEKILREGPHFIQPQRPELMEE